MGRPRLAAPPKGVLKSPRESECLDEADVLFPVDLGGNPDDWPCFVLKESIILDKAGDIANLLNAEIEGPLLIRGQLEVGKEFRHLRKIRDLKGTQVCVKNVKAFSMADGEFTIWALGRAGWFEIRPAAKYRSTYKKMTEGVSLYYTLVDIYENKKYPKRSMEMDKILNQFSKLRGHTITLTKFTKLCSENALFLFSQMLKPNEPVRWSFTKFYKWLLDSFPDTYERYTNGIKSGERDKQGLRGPSKDQAVTQTPAKMSETVTLTILDTIKHIYTSGRHRREKLTLRQLTKALYENFDFSTLLLAQEVVRVNAEPLLEILGANWQSENWKKTPLYLNLRGTLDSPEKDKDLRRIAMSLRLKSRAPGIRIPVDHKRDKLSGSSGSESSSSASSRPRCHTLIERPRVDKGKGKQISEDEEMPDIPESISSSEEKSGTSVFATSKSKYLAREIPRRSGKKAALRLVRSSIMPDNPSSLLSGADEDDDEDRRSRKRRKLSASSSNEDLDSDEPGTPNIESEGSDQGDKSDEPVNFKLDFVLESQALISTSPQGSSGIWTCQKKGCNHTITRANESDGKFNVLVHLRQHADETAAREKLILQEAKSGMEVTYLLEKIRRMGEQVRLNNQRETGGRIVPQPIQRSVMS